MPRLTIEQIAALSGVSRSTVSRVLNNHHSVRQEVRDRVIRVIDEHKYAPQAAARSLASHRTNAIAFFIPRTTTHVFSNPFFPLLIQGITEACAPRGYLVMLSIVSGDMEQDFLRILRGRHVDGVIVHAADVDDPVLPRLVAHGAPLVQIGRHPYFQNLNWVSVANRDGACAIVDHLLALGHQRVATIAGPLQEAAAVDRRDGYKQALLQAGLPLRGELMTEGDWTEHSGHRAMARLLGLDQRPTAVFSANDMMAVGALRAIHEAGLVVPDDIALVGFDDLPVAAFTSPPLTTVRQPVHELGHAAAELLLDRLDGQGQVPTQLNLPLTLVIRDSCGAGRRMAQKSGAAPVESDGRVAHAHAHSPSAEGPGRAAEATP